MAFLKVENEKYLFIRYEPEEMLDQKNLKTELLAESESGKARDTVLQFTNATAIYSMEIGIIVQFLKTLHGGGRTLRLVVSNYVCEMLKTMNIHKIPNLVLYNNLEAVQGDCPEIDLSGL
jgi:anti-anti-sigma regulatory factor